jgi:hypothetical protein
MCSPPVPTPMELIDLPIERYAYRQTKSIITTFSYPEPSPQCLVAPNDCTRLWEERITFVTSISTGRGYFDAGDPNWPPGEDEPPTPNCLEKQFGSCHYCMFEHAAVEFLHWADDFNESHLCPTNRTIPRIRVVQSVTSEEMKTAKWNGLTLTSPTPYVFFRDMTHEGGCGSPHTSILLPVIRDQVSSMDYISIHGDGVTRDLGAVKLDYRDLAYTTIGTYQVPLVPHASYLGDQKCPNLGDECKTIYDDYQPVILFRLYPGEIGKVDPAWKYCDRQQFIARDPPNPPIALIPTAVVAKPSVSPAMFASLTAGVGGPTANAPESTPKDGLMYPGVVPSRPYVAQTDAARPLQSIAALSTRPNDDLPRPGRNNDPQSPQLGDNDPPNNNPAVLVSKISLLTVLASPAGAHRNPGITPVASDPYFGVQSKPSNGLKSAKAATSLAKFGGATDDPQQQEAVFTHAGKTYTAKSVSPGKFILEGSTIFAGSSAMTVNGAVVSAINDAVVIQTSFATGNKVGSSVQPFQSGSLIGGFGLGDSNSTGVSKLIEIETATTTKKRKKNGGRKDITVGWNIFVVVTAILAFSFLR